jgi:hypothetical protein
LSECGLAGLLGCFSAERENCFMFTMAIILKDHIPLSVVAVSRGRWP